MHRQTTPPKLFDLNSGKFCQSYELANMHTQSKSFNGNTLIFMSENETSKKNAFLQFSRNYNPGCILDLRVTPRLDVFYGSRKISFSTFNELNIEYFDFFGRVGISSKNQLSEIEFYFVEACIYFLSSERYNSRPVVLFFDDDEVMSECFKYLSSSFYLHLLPTRTLNIAEFKSGLLKVTTLAN